MARYSPNELLGLALELLLENQMNFVSSHVSLSLPNPNIGPLIYSLASDSRQLEYKKTLPCCINSSNPSFCKDVTTTVSHVLLPTKLKTMF